jgi:hypothetical protein
MAEQTTQAEVEPDELLSTRLFAARRGVKRVKLSTIGKNQIPDWRIAA